jgi:hypothetical protein
MDPIPLDATDLTVYGRFMGVLSDDTFTFQWPKPPAEITIDLYGVWPGDGSAVVRNA